MAALNQALRELVQMRLDAADVGVEEVGDHTGEVIGSRRLHKVRMDPSMKRNWRVCNVPNIVWHVQAGSWRRHFVASSRAKAVAATNPISVHKYVKLNRQVEQSMILSRRAALYFFVTSGYMSFALFLLFFCILEKAWLTERVENPRD